MKKQVRQKPLNLSENTFGRIAREWLAKYSSQWAASHKETVISRATRDILPYLDERPVEAITSVELLELLNRIVARGALETARRVRQITGQIFRYAVASGRANNDPSRALRGTLPAPKVRRMAALVDPRDIADLLRTIDGYKGSAIVRVALKLAPMVFVWGRMSCVMPSDQKSIWMNLFGVSPSKKEDGHCP